MAATGRGRVLEQGGSPAPVVVEAEAGVIRVSGAAEAAEAE